MIRIDFACWSCGKSWEIDVADIEKKTIVPVCDDCYKKFLSRKERLIKSFKKKLTVIYSDYGIDVNTFNAGESIDFDD